MARPFRGFSRVGGTWWSAVALALHIAILLAITGVPLYALAAAAADLVANPGGAALVAYVAATWPPLLANTLIVTGVAVFVSVGGGTLLAVLLTRTDLPGRRPLLAALTLAACVPVYVYLALFFAWQPAVLLSQSRLACGLAYALIYLPLATLLAGAALLTVDPSAEEQALLDASPLCVLGWVALPLARWGCVAAAVVVALLVSTDYTISDMLLVRTFAEACYTQYQLDGHAAAAVLTVLPGAALLAVGLLMSRFGLGAHDLLLPWDTPAAPHRYRLGGWRWAIGLACVAGCVALLWPLGQALVRKLELGHGGAPIIRTYGGDLARGLVLAVSGATVIALPAVGIAWLLTHARAVWRSALAAALLLLLATPAPVSALSLIRLLNRPGLPGMLYDSPAVVVVGYGVRFLALAVLLLAPALRRIPQELEWAARLDGCDWLAAHVRVRWPLVWRDAAIAWLVLAVLCFGETATAQLLHPPGAPTAAITAFQLLHSGVYRDVAWLAVLSALAVLVPWGLLVIAVGRQRLRISVSPNN